jgi:hypothetical protein
VDLALYIYSISATEQGLLNCGADNHQAPKCPKPKNKALYKKNCKAFLDAKAKNSDGSTAKSKDALKIEDAHSQRKKWSDQGISFIKMGSYISIARSVVLQYHPLHQNAYSFYRTRCILQIEYHSPICQRVCQTSTEDSCHCSRFVYSIQ